MEKVCRTTKFALVLTENIFSFQYLKERKKVSNNCNSYVVVSDSHVTDWWLFNESRLSGRNLAPDGQCISMGPKTTWPSIGEKWMDDKQEEILCMCWVSCVDVISCLAALWWSRRSVWFLPLFPKRHVFLWGNKKIAKKCVFPKYVYKHCTWAQSWSWFEVDIWKTVGEELLQNHTNITIALIH